MADTGGTAPFRDLAPGADTTTPPAASGSVGLLADPSEPAVVGACPVAPDVVRVGSRAQRGRSVRAISGHPATAARGTRGRARFELRWVPADASALGTLRGFLRDDCGWTEGAFTVPVDGAGSTAVAVRLLAPASVRAVAGGGIEVTASAESVSEDGS